MLMRLGMESDIALLHATHERAKQLDAHDSLSTKSATAT